MITKTCKITGQEFVVSDGELAILDKISPVLGGEKHLIPAPDISPLERRRRLLAFANEFNFYRHKCDFSGEDIVSIYSPASPVKVFHTKYWNDENVNAAQYARDFDFSRPFFEQWYELFLDVPRASLWSSSKQPNCEYTHDASGNQNCYLCSGISGSEDCYFTTSANHCHNAVDTYCAGNSEIIYQCIDVGRAYRSTYCGRCENITDCHYCFDCVNCRDCFGCYRLENSQFCFFNEQLSEEEYRRRVKEILDSPERDSIITANFNQIRNDGEITTPVITQSENCTGNFIEDSKNCFDSWGIFGGENIYNCFLSGFCDNSIDGNFLFKASWIYQGVNMAAGSSRCAFSLLCVNSISDVYYCSECENSSDLFGCVGLDRKRHCILNKQYSPAEYETKVAEIIAHMKETGEWGEFFPAKYSPFGYNESPAETFFPLGKDEALQMGFNWSEYTPPLAEVTRKISAHQYDMLPLDINEIPDDITNWALECTVSGRFFQLTPQELAFYKKHNIRLPRVSPLERYKKRVLRRVRNQMPWE